MLHIQVPVPRPTQRDNSIGFELLLVSFQVSWQDPAKAGSHWCEPHQHGWDLGFSDTSSFLGETVPIQLPLTRPLQAPPVPVRHLSFTEVSLAAAIPHWILQL